MNTKPTPETATMAAVPNIDKTKAADTHPVQAPKVEDTGKPETVITPAPKK